MTDFEKWIRGRRGGSISILYPFLENTCMLLPGRLPFFVFFFLRHVFLWYCYESPYPILHSFFLFPVIISGWSLDSRHYIFFFFFSSFFPFFLLLLTTYFWCFLPALTKRLYIYILSFILCHVFCTCMSCLIGGVYWGWLVLCHEIRTFLSSYNLKCIAERGRKSNCSIGVAYIIDHVGYGNMTFIDKMHFTSWYTHIVLLS